MNSIIRAGKSIAEELLSDDDIKSLSKIGIDYESIIHYYHKLDRNKQVLKEKLTVIANSEVIDTINKLIDQELKIIRTRKELRRGLIQDYINDEVEL